MGHVGADKASPVLSSGADNVIIVVEEAGALNTRTVGTATLGCALYSNGWVGEVALQGNGGFLHMKISKMVAVGDSEPSMPVPVPSAPAASASLAGDCVSVSGADELQPWVTAASAAEHQPYVSEGRFGPFLAVPDAPASGQPSSSTPKASTPRALMPLLQVGQLLPVLPVDPGSHQPAVPFVPEPHLVDRRAAAFLPVNMTVCNYNVSQLLPELASQQAARNYGYIPVLKRGVDTSKDLTWTAFGWDMATASYPPGDILEYENQMEPMRVDLAKKLSAALATVVRADNSPQMNNVIACLKDSYAMAGQNLTPLLTPIRIGLRG